jgi:hypothetical protein
MATFGQMPIVTARATLERIAPDYAGSWGKTMVPSKSRCRCDDPSTSRECAK